MVFPLERAGLPKLGGGGAERQEYDKRQRVR